MQGVRRQSCSRGPPFEAVHHLVSIAELSRPPAPQLGGRHASEHQACNMQNKPCGGCLHQHDRRGSMTGVQNILHVSATPATAASMGTLLSHLHCGSQEASVHERSKHAPAERLLRLSGACWVHFCRPLQAPAWSQGNRMHLGSEPPPAANTLRLHFRDALRPPVLQIWPLLMSQHAPAPQGLPKLRVPAL